MLFLRFYLVLFFPGKKILVFKKKDNHSLCNNSWDNSYNFFQSCMFKCLPCKSLYTMPVKVIYMMVITESCHYLNPHVTPVLLIREVNAMGKAKSQRSFQFHCCHPCLMVHFSPKEKSHCPITDI